MAVETTYTVTYSVTDGAGAAASATFTTVVTAAAPPPPPPPPSPEPPPPPPPPSSSETLLTATETNSPARTYSFVLASRGAVSVSLTGMNRDIDCSVNGSACSNRGGTSDDDWSGELDAGTHTVSVYPYGGGSGSWTLSVSAPGAVEPPPSAPTGVQRTVETRVGLAYSTERSSFGQTYTFTLASRQTVNVSLTGMDRDIDCSVNGLACSNRGGTSDDDWSGELGPGTHTVRVYPYHGGTGAWTITASVNCPAGHFASGGSCHRYVVPERPIDGPVPMTAEGAEVLGCNNDTELPADQECVDGFVVFKDSINVTATPVPIPLLGTIVIVIPPPLPLPPTTTPPTWPSAMMPQELRDAIDDAITKSGTCSVDTERLGSVSAHAALTAVTEAEQIVPGLSQPGCTARPGGPPISAFVDAIPGTTIYICPAFFNRSESDMSLTIMHEGLHLAGVYHTDFGDNTAPGDPGPMNAAIRSACGY